jgi:selenide,water dikinase
MVAVGTADLTACSATPRRGRDGLVLTKPIGVGMITTAAKRGSPPPSSSSGVATMTELNAAASRTAVEHGVRAGTDVTGFGLLGHLRKLLEASGQAAAIDAAAVPLLSGALELAQRDVVAGGTKRNHAWLGPTTDWGATTLPEQLVLADAQTSGGLLLATGDPTGLIDALTAASVTAWRIGSVIDGVPGAIRVEGRLH